MKTKRSWMWLSTLATLVGCGALPEAVGPDTGAIGSIESGLATCEIRTYNMKTPIQYTAPSGTLLVSAVPYPRSTWWTGEAKSPCPDLSAALGRNSFTLDFDYYYADNTDSCTYTFCSRAPFCESRSFDMKAPIQYSAPGFNNIDSVMVVPGSQWRPGNSYGYGPCPDLSGAVGQASYTLNFDSTYSDNSGTCAYTFCSHPRLICEDRVYRGMQGPLQYSTPLPSLTIVSVTEGLGVWDSGTAVKRCPDMYWAIGKTSYTLDFDTSYIDNSGTCGYTFCSQL